MSVGQRENVMMFLKLLLKDSRGKHVFFFVPLGTLTVPHSVMFHSRNTVIARLWDVGEGESVNILLLTQEQSKALLGSNMKKR